MHGNSSVDFAERRPIVVHNAFVGVRATEVPEINFVDFVEVVCLIYNKTPVFDLQWTPILSCLTWVHLVSHNGDVVVAISAVMFMVQANGVHQFVDDDSVREAGSRLVFAQVHNLSAIILRADVA